MQLQPPLVPPPLPPLAGTFRANRFNHTLLAPTNEALAAAEGSLPPDVQGCERVLRFHTISRPGALPDDFRQGAAVMTLLPGHNVMIQYMRCVRPGPVAT
jgi:hypothetical protein